MLAVADISASESKKITVTDFLGKAVTLIADATIPNAKIVFGSASIPGSALATGAVTAAKLADDAVTAAKLGDESTVDLVTTLPATGAFTGQLALDTDDLKVYCWDGSTWQSIKAAGSVNVVNGSTANIINIVVTTSGSDVTVTATLDNTSAAAQFLAGPTGSAGAVSYRTITGDDLPTATNAAKGGISVNGEGLRVDGVQLEIDNDLTASATYGVVTYNAKGLITAGRAILSSDMPAATVSAKGAILPGTGLSVEANGTLDHTNSATPGIYTKVTVDAVGHVTVGDVLASADLPNHSATLLTSGTLSTARLGGNAITGDKLANSSVTQFGGSANTTGVVTFPTAQFTGQYFFDSINGDLYLWDGNAWQPITITAGEIIFGGTFNASTGSGTGLVASVTTAGQAIGLTVGSALPAASATNSRYYLVVSVGGTITSGQAPNVTLAPPDMVLSNGTAWVEIDISTSVTGATQASGVTVTPAGGIGSTNVQAALQELDTEKIGAGGATITGELLIGTAGSLVFEGSTADGNETTLAVTDPTADRTITLPNVTGTVITTGDTSTVTNTMLAGSIALSKLANLTSGNIIVGSSGNVPTAVALSGDVTITNAGVAAIGTGVIVNSEISASAAIDFSKLASLSSGAILVGNSSNVAASVAVTGDVTLSNAGVTAITAGAIVNADVNATAAIAFSKLANVSATDKLLGRSTAGAGAIEEITCTAAGRALIDDADASAQRTTLGLAIGTNVQAYDADTAKTDVVQSFTAAQRASITGLTDGATITPDFAVANNYSVTLAGNRTLGNPSNQVAGQSGSIFITQDATGSRTLAYASNWDFAGGTAPVLSTAANAVDRLDYIVRASGSIHTVFTAAYS